MNIAITGAGGGLGRSVAEYFTTKGHVVFGCDASEPAVQALEQSRVVADAMAVDVSRYDQIEAWFARISKMTDRVHVLINNVGVAGPRVSVEDIRPEDWRRTMAANLDAALFTSQLALPGMKRARSGVILNVSTASVSTNPTMRAAYVVSKAALEALTRAIAREAGPFNVRCNAVRPGMINNERLTRILRLVASQSGKTPEEAQSDQLRYLWLGRVTEMIEIAELLLFLGSDAASSITGQVIGIDGGMQWEE